MLHHKNFFLSNRNLLLLVLVSIEDIDKKKLLVLVPVFSTYIHTHTHTSGLIVLLNYKPYAFDKRFGSIRSTYLSLSSRMTFIFGWKNWVTLLTWRERSDSWSCVPCKSGEIWLQ